MSDLCVLAASLLVQGKTPGWQLAAPPRPFWMALLQPRSAVDQVCEPSLAPPVSLHRPEFSRTQFSRTQSSRAQFSPSVRAVAATSVAQTMPRPRSEAQLYLQRVAALQSGQLYTRLSVDSFQSRWAQATRQPQRADWLKLLRHEAKAVATGQGKAKLSVLLGDAQALWFPVERLARDRFWLNQGIAGDKTANLLQRLSAFDQTRPDAIHVTTGANDLQQGAADGEILTNIQQLIRQLRARHPAAQIYIHAILPSRLTTLPAPRVAQLNSRISQLTQQAGVRFIPLQPALTNAEGKLQAQL